MGDEPYAAFLPWIVFAVVARGHGQGVTWAAISAVITASAILATKRHSDIGVKNVLAIGATAWFSALAVAGFMASETGWLAHNSRAISALGFTVIALASLARIPFTDFYTRPHARPAEWSERPFRRVNVHITLQWAVAFALMALGHALAPIVDRSSAYTVFNWVLPIALVAVCAHRSKLVWEYFEDEDEARSSRDPFWDLSLDWAPMTTPGDEQ